MLPSAGLCLPPPHKSQRLRLSPCLVVDPPTHAESRVGSHSLAMVDSRPQLPVGGALGLGEGLELCQRLSNDTRQHAPHDQCVNYPPQRPPAELVFHGNRQFRTSIDRPQSVSRDGRTSGGAAMLHDQARSLDAHHFEPAVRCRPNGEGSHRGAIARAPVLKDRRSVIDCQNPVFPTRESRGVRQQVEDVLGLRRDADRVLHRSHSPHANNGEQNDFQTVFSGVRASDGSAKPS